MLWISFIMKIGISEQLISVMIISDGCLLGEILFGCHLLTLYKVFQPINLIEQILIMLGYFLVTHPVVLSNVTAAAILCLGFGGYFIFRSANHQRVSHNGEFVNDAN